jgi:hypothetical protein
MTFFAHESFQPMPIQLNTLLPLENIVEIRKILAVTPNKPTRSEHQFISGYIDLKTANELFLKGFQANDVNLQQGLTITRFPFILDGEEITIPANIKLVECTVKGKGILKHSSGTATSVSKEAIVLKISADDEDKAVSDSSPAYLPPITLPYQALDAKLA